MTERQETGSDPRKLLAAGALRVRIALVSGAVLTVGFWLAPPVARTPLSSLEERPAPLLEEQVQLRESARAFIGVQDVAVRVREYSVGIPASAPLTRARRTDFSEPELTEAQVGGFGVFLTDTYVLAHSAALAGRSTVQLSMATGRVADGRVVAYDPPTGLVLLQVEPSARPPLVLAAEPPDVGALAVAVGRAGDRDVAVPVFVTSRSGDGYRIGSLDDAVLPGMPVFTLGGELFAVAAPDEHETRAIPVNDAADRLIARASAGERQASLGLGFQSLEGLLTQAFGAEGVILTEVVAGGPADEAGVEVGDVLLALNDRIIDSVETASRELAASEIGVPSSLRLRRNGQTRDVEVTPATAYAVAALSRRLLDGQAEPEARALFSQPLLERSVIPPSARVLTINGRPATSRTQAQRELRAARAPIPVLLRQGETQFFVAVDPTP